MPCRLDFEYILKIEERARAGDLPIAISNHKIIAGLLFLRINSEKRRYLIYRGSSDISDLTIGNIYIPVRKTAVEILFDHLLIRSYRYNPSYSYLCEHGARKVVDEWFEDPDLQNRLAFCCNYLSDTHMY